MSIYRNKEGEGFAALAASQGWGRNRQIRELNRIYNGKVAFGKWYGDYNYSGEYAICVEWTSDDIEDLELPECKFIKAECLFDDGYAGKVNTVRLPKCLAIAHLDRIGKGLSYEMVDGTDSASTYYNKRSLKVVIPSDTRCIAKKRFTIVKKMEDGSEQKETVIISTRMDRA